MGSNHAGAWSVPGSQVDVFELGRSHFQRSSKKCGMSERDREASTVKIFWPNSGGRSMEKNEQSDMH